jgi:hypothetical protein
MNSPILAEKIDRVFKKVEPWIGLPALVFSYIIFCLYVPVKQRGGFANLETYIYIPAHLTPKAGVLSNIFDAKVHDSWGFQNRSLSFYVDYLDVQALGWFLEQGYPHFLSLFHFLGVGVIIFGLWHIFSKELRLDRFTSFFLCILLLLTPSFHVTASYSRSAKMGVAIGALLFLYISLRWILNRSPGPFLAAILWILAFAFSFFDMMWAPLCIYFSLITATFIWLQDRKIFSRRIVLSLSFFASCSFRV